MVWIKRNLFFFIGGLLALGLLGAAGFYDYTSWSRNSDRFDKLNEIYANLKDLNDPDKSPGNDQINKTQQAIDQEAQLKTWLDQAKAYFQPIAAIPPSDPGNPVTSRTFADALQHTLELLQHEAVSANVLLPAPVSGSAQYAFSFQAQSSLVQFSGGLDMLAVQLGEVKTIAELLYAAGINQLDGIQRVHVSDDDLTGPGSDYVSELSVTNGLGIITPYVLNFRCFTPEIAQVFAGFAGSPHGFVIKSINVQPAGAAGQMGSMQPFQNNRFDRFGMNQPPGPQPPLNGVPGRGGMTTVLQEQLLRVSMEVEIVKLQPKN